MFFTIKKLFISLSFFLITLILLEFFVNFAEIESKSNFEVDSIFGKKLRPEAKLCYFNEGFFLGNTNKYGYFGSSYPPGEHSNSKRIALIGDSYVEALHVFDRISMRKLLENKLWEKLNIRYEVMNFGRSGFVMSDMYIYHKNFCNKFKPDLIFVFLHNEDFYRQSYQQLLPNLFMSENRLRQNNSFIHGKAFENYRKTRFIREKSNLLRMMNNCTKLYKNNLHWHIVFDKFFKGNSKKKLVPQKTIEKKINTINKEILVEWSKNPAIILVLCDKTEPDIKNYLEQLGITSIKLYESIQKIEEKGYNLNYWPTTGKTGHWNQQGHQFISEILSSWIENNTEIHVKYIP